jgi:small GTP-binding protein
MTAPDSSNIKNIKIVLIGDCGVGKSSISLRYTSNEFDNNYISTGGAAYSTKLIQKYGDNLQLDIWDTAGQERYRSLGRTFYKDAFIVILVYDITREETFNNLKNIWMEELNKNGEEKPILAVVGNKIDQYEEEATVNEEDARKFAESNNAVFQQVSAKTGSNIEILFNLLIDEYYKNNFPDKIREERERRKSKKIVAGNHKDEKNGKKKKRKFC